MCELARVLVNHGRSMNLAILSQLGIILQEQGRKSYVASYWANKELVIPRIFSHELCQ